MEKVKFTQRQADSFEGLLKANYGNKKHAFSKHSAGYENDGHPLRNISLYDFATALLIGYEVEKTPHEQIRELFNDVWCYDQQIAVLKTLEILNIKVSGVRGEFK